MKTLTLRNIPEDVKEIIVSEGFYYYPATKRIYAIIRQIPRLRKKIAELEALSNDSKMDPYDSNFCYHT